LKIVRSQKKKLLAPVVQLYGPPYSTVLFWDKRKHGVFKCN
jgi:hypothetical protein